MVLAEAYEEAKRRDDALFLRTCAYKQGHGPAAVFLGRDAELEGNYLEALNYYQDGTRFGNDESAAALMLFFRIENWDRLNAKQLNRARELGLQPDFERKERYKAVKNALELNPDLKLARLDQVVPLPPAELPPWNGVKDAIEPDPDGPPTY